MKALVFLAMLAFAAPAAATNIALGKPVTLIGTFGNSTAGTPIPWADPAPGPASLVTDGVFSPAHTNWQVNSIWWHEYPATPNDPPPTPSQIVIDLQGIYKLTGAIVQADNNEIYLLEYLDVADVWQPLWNVPSFGTDGVVTRPNPADDTEIFNFASSVDAKALRISAQGGDLYYSVTEVQVFAAVPEPATLALLSVGLLGGLCFRRRNRK